MAFIEIRSLTKVLKKRPVLSDVSLSFDKGKIYGLYGRNGSGKTMLLRAIAGLIFPSEGEIVIDGKQLHRDISFPDSVGVIIETTSMLPQMDAYANLKNLSKIKKVATDEDIQNALKRVGLFGERKKVREYSLGMRQKLAIAQAIFEKPDLLLLDEPTNGLDEDSVKQVRRILLEEKERDCLLILASHNNEDLVSLCDVIIHLKEGKVVDNGSFMMGLEGGRNL